jgi:membrane protein implicated in regulation of membrane protease activity
MDPYTVQPWMPWAVVTALLMLGAWMRMGSSLFALGIAAAIALVEALLRYPLAAQVATFVVSSGALVFAQWVLGRGRGRGGGAPAGKGTAATGKEASLR